MRGITFLITAIKVTSFFAKDVVSDIEWSNYNAWHIFSFTTILNVFKKESIDEHAFPLFLSFCIQRKILEIRHLNWV